MLDPGSSDYLIFGTLVIFCKNLFRGSLKEGNEGWRSEGLTADYADFADKTGMVFHPPSSGCRGTTARQAKGNASSP
jgi:hypothetical protein